MPAIDTLYQCPVCESEHTAEEWNETTEEDFETHNIMPIEVAHSPEFRYTCPTCWSVADIEDIVKK
jgi:hypothetical protein